MYVSVGSVGNVDGDSFRSRIRRIEGLAEEKSLPEPVDFTKAEIFADGLRNEVGLAWADDGKKVLYGVENGMDNLFRAELGGDIHNDNPAEELNAFPVDDVSEKKGRKHKCAPPYLLCFFSIFLFLFSIISSSTNVSFIGNVVDQPGKFYGYPFCFSEYKLDSDKSEGPGAQWALENQDVADDDYCKDTEKNVPPLYSMQAHSAPLGMAFYGKDWKNISECCLELSILDANNSTNSSCQMESSMGLPCEYLGDLFIPFHGSWNR
jgi:glucose/arabinose dehydrogenase